MVPLTVISGSRSFGPRGVNEGNNSNSEINEIGYTSNSEINENGNGENRASFAKQTRAVKGAKVIIIRCQGNYNKAPR